MEGAWGLNLEALGLARCQHRMTMGSYDYLFHLQMRTLGSQGFWLQDLSCLPDLNSGFQKSQFSEKNTKRNLGINWSRIVFISL